MLRIEEDTCRTDRPCPKIASIEGGEDWIFVVGKRPSLAEQALFDLPDDEGVVKYPRWSALKWAAPQLGIRPTP
jgi:hypothetical protein